MDLDDKFIGDCTSKNLAGCDFPKQCRCPSRRVHYERNLKSLGAKWNFGIWGINEGMSKEDAYELIIELNLSARQIIWDMQREIRHVCRYVERPTIILDGVTNAEDTFPYQLHSLCQMIFGEWDFH